MDVAAKLTSKGQITVPKAVRSALNLEPGDSVLFHVEDDHAILARTPDFLELAGSVKVPKSKRGASWERIHDEAWRARGEEIA